MVEELSALRNIEDQCSANDARTIGVRAGSACVRVLTRSWSLSKNELCTGVAHSNGSLCAVSSLADVVLDSTKLVVLSQAY